MTYALVLVVWLLVGAVVGVVEARHGAWRRSWAVAAVFGPFAIPLALQRRHQAKPDTVVLSPGRAGRGPVDLLIGLDGSESSLAAASLALHLFGPRARRVTLTSVLDLDTARSHDDDVTDPEPWPEERDARLRLDEAATALQESTGVRPGSVILAGRPADALEQHALAEGYEVIVVGHRGKGLSKRVLGSCASDLAGRTKVPVLLVPAEPAVARP